MSTPEPVPLSQLVQSSAPDDVLALELAICTALNLPTSAWQPVQTIPTLLATNAQIISSYSVVTALFAQGGYPSYAALMVDASGNPITVWMDLIVLGMYGILRNPASLGAGNVPVNNAGITSYPYSPTNPLRFQNPTTLATYTTTGTGSIAASGPSTPAVQADAAFVGSIGTTGAGVTLTLLTPLAGVTVQPLTASIVGSDAESNAALLLRGQGTIAAISPNGAALAYQAIAQGIPQGTPSPVVPYAIGTPVTRSRALSTSGSVTFVVANALGPVSPTDLAVVTAAIQTQVVPSSVSCQVVSATAFTLSLQYVVTIKQSANLTVTQILTNISDALATLCANFSIGGYNSGAPGYANYIPFQLVADTIFNANSGTIDLGLTPFSGSGGPLGGISLTDVPVLAPPVGSVDFVQA